MMKYERRPANMPGMPAGKPTAAPNREEPSKPKVGAIPSYLTQEDVVNPKGAVGAMNLETPGHQPSVEKRGPSTLCPPPKVLNVMPGSYPPKNFPDRIATYNNQGTPPFADGGEKETNC